MDKNKTFSIISLCCGIAGFVVWWIPFLEYISVLFPIAAIVFGAISMKGLKKENQPNGMAVAGFVLGIIGMAFFIIASLVVLCALGFVATTLALIFN